MRALTATTCAPASDVALSRACASASIGAGSARSARVTATTPCLTSKASRAARCSAACGIHGSSAATTKSTAGTGPTPASIVETKRSWPGTSTKATSPDLRQRGPAVAELDRESAPVLLGQPVGLLPGQGPHQRRLAVVDMACRGDDLHGSVLDGEAYGVDDRGVVRRVHRDQVEEQPAVSDVPENRGSTRPKPLGQ